MRRILEILRQRHRERATGGERRRDVGMTLLEIMIVIALIGLVMGSIGFALNSRFNKGKIQAAKIATKQIAEAAATYMMENNGNCPGSLEDLKANKNLTKVSKDPWGKDFLLKCPGTGDPDGADVISTGPDKQEGSADDIKSWE